MAPPGLGPAVIHNGFPWAPAGRRRTVGSHAAAAIARLDLMARWEAGHDVATTAIQREPVPGPAGRRPWPWPPGPTAIRMICQSAMPSAVPSDVGTVGSRRHRAHIHAQAAGIRTVDAARAQVATARTAASRCRRTAVCRTPQKPERGRDRRPISSSSFTAARACRAWAGLPGAVAMVSTDPAAGTANPAVRERPRQPPGGSRPGVAWAAALAARAAAG